MRFLGLSPASAWALLAGTAALVVLLYLLKPSPRRFVLTSSLIWERVLRERRRKPERWRWWASLALALAIALSIAAALTRPEIAVVSGNAERVAFVVDNSVTMGARRSDGRTRLEHAVARARELIGAGGAGSRYLVVDTMRAIATPVFEPAHAALERLAALSVRAGQPRFPGLMQQQVAMERVVFLTDGVARVEPPEGIETVPVFEFADNAGITAFEVRPVPADARRFEAYVEILNASQAERRVELKVMGADAPALTRSFQLAGGATAKAVLDVSRFDTGPLRATVESAADALDVDDSAYAFMPSKRVARVAVVTRGNAFLERTLRLLPRAQFTLLTPERFRAANGYDAVVFDRWAPAAEPAVPSLLIGPGVARWLPTRVGDLGETRLESWDRTHPVLRNVSLQDVTVERAALLRPELFASGPHGLIATLAAGPRGQPLILASEAGSRWLELAFALEESNFPLQQGFPVFLANALAWMTGEPLALERTLGAVDVPAAGMRVVDLDGKEVRTRQVPHATAFDAPLPELYTATNADQRLRIAVNLTDARVTAINASPFATVAKTTAQVQAFARSSAEPWVLLLTLAVVLLALEWFAYHRRVTV